MRSSLIHLASITLPTAILACACGGLETAPAPSSEPTAAPPSLSTHPPASTEDPPAAPQTIPNNAACPVTAPAPIDCGPYAEACAGARPIAIGTFAAISAFTVDASSVYWTAATTDLTPGCGGTIYRAPKSGGASQQIVTGHDVGTIAADDVTLYWSEYTSGSTVIRYHAWARDWDTEIGTTTSGGAYGVPLTRTPGGVVFATETTMWHATAWTLEPIASTAGFYIGSLPTFDDGIVFASTFPFGASSDLATVSRLGSSDPTAIAGGAASRGRASVIAAGSDLFYITGDDMGDGEHLFRPMGISRIAKSGGTPVVVVPSGDTPIASLAVDETFVYFVTGAQIARVPRDGGATTIVATLGAPLSDLVVDDHALYFFLHVTERHGEITGPGNVIAAIAR